MMGCGGSKATVQDEAPKAAPADTQAVPADTQAATKPPSEEAKLEDGQVWLACIGAVCHPQTLTNRGCKAIKSVPAILNDHKIYFAKNSGMAGTKPEPGYRSSHCVVHLLDAESIAKMDKVEAGYFRHPCTVTLYDGKEMAATVYQFAKKDESSETDMYEEGESTERYLDIIRRGCVHFGVKQEYIDFLNSVPFKPRTKPENFKSFGEAPEGVVMTMDELAQAAKDGRFVIGINDKVLEFKDELTGPALSFFADKFGTDLTFMLAMYLYEPLYAVPTSPETMEKAHKNHLEDMMIDIMGKMLPENREIIAALKK